MNFSLQLFGLGILLVLVQLLAAVPWLVAFNRSAIRVAGAGFPDTPQGFLRAVVLFLLFGQNFVYLAIFLGIVVIAGLTGPLLMLIIQDPATLEFLGRF